MRWYLLFSILVAILVAPSSIWGEHPLSTAGIIVTSAAGDKLAEMSDVDFKAGIADSNVLTIFPEDTRQTMDGIGSSFTESSAFVLAHLDPKKREELMREIFADFTLARTHIGACDFTVEGKYSYADESMDDFSIAVDSEGFDPRRYPGVKDPKYDLLPMIEEALSINPDLRIVASAWTAPAWMKDIGTWYIQGSEEDNWQGTGGSLKYEHIADYADYLIRYLQAYRNEGVDIWGITPVNEPHGNNGQWESMNFSAESQGRFIRKHLGPRMRESGFDDVRLLIYDQNRDGMEHWADVILSDEKTNPYVYGTAIHWYESTDKVYEDALDRIHQKYPDYAIIHTEGCIDNLGGDAPGGVTDPEGYKEEGWFDNDEFWWSDSATDWAYSVTWQGVNVEDHPIYTPVHRYARNIIESIDHWVQGWIDWNIVLDKDGGPNHVGNFCGAPIMIDTETEYVYYTPVYYVLKQFARTIEPGDRAVRTEQVLPDAGDDDFHACATISPDGMLSVQILNTTQHPIDYNLQIGEGYATVTVPANAVQTVRVQL